MRSYLLWINFSVGLTDYSMSNLNVVFSCLLQLRVLDLGWNEHESLPDSIGELKHLRYLCACVKHLPKGIILLQYLRTLILLGSYCLRQLPTGFSKLTSLRHLQIGSSFADRDMNSLCNGLDDMPPLFRELKHLQMLINL